MEFLERTFFEVPVLVYLTCGLAELITVAIWRRTQAPRARMMLAVWPLLAIAVWILSAAVETDREKVLAAWDDMEAAIRAEDVPRLMGHVADDFESDGVDRKGLEQLAEEAGRRLEPEDLTIGGFTLETMEAGVATARVTAIYRGEPMSQLVTFWELTFAPQADGRWRLASVECTNPRGLNLADALSGLRRLKRSP